MSSLHIVYLILEIEHLQLKKFPSKWKQQRKKKISSTFGWPRSAGIYIFPSLPISCSFVIVFRKHSTRPLTQNRMAYQFTLFRTDISMYFGVYRNQYHHQSKMMHGRNSKINDDLLAFGRLTEYHSSKTQVVQTQPLYVHFKCVWHGREIACTSDILATFIHSFLFIFSRAEQIASPASV